MHPSSSNMHALFTADDIQNLSAAGFVDVEAYRRAQRVVRSLVRDVDYALFTADDIQNLSAAGFVDVEAYRRAQRVGRLEKSLESALPTRIQQVNALLLAFTPAGRMKREREDRGVVTKQRYKELQELYAAKDCSFLWDAEAVYGGLLLPTVNPAEDMHDNYSYIGRAGAEKLYARILKLKNANRMQVIGAKGTGKSTVMSTVAGFLLGNGKKIVYISASRYIAEPARVLLEALLLAFGQCEEVLEELQYLPTVKDLVQWCEGRTGLLFIIDDWEQLDPRKNDKEAQRLHHLKAELVRASGVSVCIKVLSINSPEQYESANMDKAEDYELTEELDGPYTEEELNTWITQANLPVSALVDLDNLTGGMPRLLRFYGECGGDRHQWLKCIEAKYQDKLWTEFVGKLESKEDLVAAMNMVMADGKLPPRLAPKIKLTCFYRDLNGRFRLLSPYFRTQAETLLTGKGKELDKKLLLSVWTEAVELDSRSELAERNPARIGWHIEGLVISVIRLQGRLFDDDAYSFKMYRTYAHGHEVAALCNVALHDLREGVLMGPQALNEEAVDLVYIKLSGNGNYVVVALQIIVAQWKAKEKKRSHTVWKDEVLPEWKQGLGAAATFESRYYYAMPDTVKLEGLPVTDVAGLKKLSDIDKSLEWFDQIKLTEPKIPSRKQATRFCSGKEETCGNRANCNLHFEGDGCACEYRCRWHPA